MRRYATPRCRHRPRWPPRRPPRRRAARFTTALLASRDPLALSLGDEIGAWSTELERIDAALHELESVVGPDAVAHLRARARMGEEMAAAIRDVVLGDISEQHPIAAVHEGPWLQAVASLTIRRDDAEQRWVHVDGLCAAPWNLIDLRPHERRRVVGAGTAALGCAVRLSRQLAPVSRLAPLVAAIRGRQRPVAAQVTLDAYSPALVRFYAERGFVPTDPDDHRRPMRLDVGASKRWSRSGAFRP